MRFAFEGADLFEMEDQRQWLDGSYKTYFRKLSQTPLPYPLTPGEAVTQSVSMTVSSPTAHGNEVPDENAATTLSVALGGVIPGAAPLPKVMNFVLQMMDCVLQMTDFVLRMTNSVLEMTGFVFKMTDFVLKMTDLGVDWRGGPSTARRRHGRSDEGQCDEGQRTR